MKEINSTNIEALQSLLEENQFQFKEVNETVELILQKVKTKGDTALKEFTKRFDQAVLNDFKVTEEEMQRAIRSIDKTLYSDLEKAYQNIVRFHKEQLPKTYFMENQNSKIGQLIRPIEKVGMYVPGGTAAYPSTVLMNAAPANVAGVKRLVMITPPNEKGGVNPVLLAAAKIANITEVYKIGGAQGIAALTYGTKTIPKVDKIVGPGNIYVAIAKKQVQGLVGIDMIAGPSEVVIIADESANPTFVAADLLAQAEHDELAKVILITPSEELVAQVKKEINNQLITLSRRQIAQKCIDNNGYFIITKNIEEAINISNQIAPEHLELQFENADEYVDKINNAGAVFVGAYTPEPVGDYFAGPNHTLPTSGTARFASALSTTDFIKTISYLNYSKESLNQVRDSIIRIAESEGLTAHANAIKVRDLDV
jgi:histidinol dehydrogenase